MNERKGEAREHPSIDAEVEINDRKLFLFHGLRSRRRRALITDAKRSPEQNLQSREAQYLWLQALRVPFILLSIASAWWLGNWWIATILFIVSVPLPWIAVMLGNAKGEARDPREKNVYKPALSRAYAALEEQSQQQLSSHDASVDMPPAVIDHESQSE
ncbi:DUF3099 domain-containing protein [Corynebacterium sp. NML130628]|uniref:DUF3099 domain-containing protein n=1 Tax=Corynebacterium sp. NML130628 TaxID=1906333 RepID=UPI0008FB2C24|nr:DUF3099 domain-containing protein [Corynebacterium sp. NML130628]OIR45521.1 hypothetical protein BJP07_03935 [Corynebacterium sp. NML130628]